MAWSDALELAAPWRCAGCGRLATALCPGCRGAIRRAAPRASVAPVDRVVVPWNYSGPARKLVLGLKLQGRRECALPLAQAMSEEVAAQGLVGSVLTWVPGRRAGIRRRGFDHAEVLARQLGVLRGLPVARLLERAGGALDQAGLSAPDRWRNLERAFAAVPCPVNVVLVDDLVTTGATIRACAVALVAAGATGVEVVAPCSA